MNSTFLFSLHLMLKQRMKLASLDGPTVFYGQICVLSIKIYVHFYFKLDKQIGYIIL